MNKKKQGKKKNALQKKCLFLAMAFCILFSETGIANAALVESFQEKKQENTEKTAAGEQKNGSEEKQQQTPAISLTAPSAVLMEGSTGTVLYEKEKDTERMIASVTKVMTMLLIFEALDAGKLSLQDSVMVSAHAASMGGSQVYLEENETQTVETMIKCICIASANDAAVAMAEHIAGSEEAFVEKMNARAAELGMAHTHFLNCCGLDDDITEGHYSSAGDVALMSRELVTKHPQVKDYTTVWMDTFVHTTRKGESEFGLTNTNRLVRTYEGITGLKTGSTSKAKYCLSATANRNGVDMIAVVLGAATPKDRFAEAASLLNYGFANTQVYKDEAASHQWEPAAVRNGKKETVSVAMDGDFSHIFIHGEDISAVTGQAVFEEKITAPVKKGDLIGMMKYFYQEKELGQVPLIAAEDIEKAGFFDCFWKMFCQYAGIGKLKKKK